MAYEVARVHGLIRSEFQELKAQRGSHKVTAIHSEACSVPENKHHRSGLSQDSCFLHELQGSEMSQAPPAGSSTQRETKIEQGDYIMADLLDQIMHSIIDDAGDERFPTMKTVESNGQKTSDSYTMRTPTRNSQMDVQVVSPTVAASAALLPRANSGLFSKSYAESVTGTKQSSSSATSTPQFEEPSPSSRADTCERPRDELEHSRSPRNEGSEWKQRQSWQGQELYRGAAGGGGLKKAAARCHSLPPTAGAGAVEWHGGPGLRAVLLRSESSKPESRGTGVFLPSSVGGTIDHRRKPACSIVLLPLRIIQVLNLNVENLRCHPATAPAALQLRRSKSGSARVQPSPPPPPPPPPMYVMELSPTRTSSMSMTKADATCSRASQSCQTQTQQPTALSLELGLPTEWTY